MKIGTLIAAGAAILSVGLGSSQAVAACWSSTAVEAAQVRDFETMLMVATLRCQIKGMDLSNDYNQFIRGKRAVLTGVNDELRARYAGEGLKGNAALNAYDRFVTSLANGYGGGSDKYGCEDFRAMMSSANAAPASKSALLALAVQSGSDPVPAEQRCATARIALAN